MQPDRDLSLLNALKGPDGFFERVKWDVLVRHWGWEVTVAMRNAVSLFSIRSRQCQTSMRIAINRRGVCRGEIETMLGLFWLVHRYQDSLPSSLHRLQTK